MDVETALVGLKKDLYEFRDETKFLTHSVNEFAFKFQNRSGKSGQSKGRVGTYLAASGGAICAVGVGLSFVTIGGSVGIILLGGILCGIGGATNSVVGKSSNGHVAVSQIRRDVLADAFEKYNSRLNVIKEKSLQIGRELERFGRIDVMFPKWCDFWSDFWNGILLKGEHSDTMSWREVVETVQTKQTTKKGGGSSKNSVKEVHIDVTGINAEYFLDSFEDAQRRRINKVVKSAKDLAITLQDTCPSTAEIDRMIEETSAGL